MSIPVHVTVGVGDWVATTYVELIACPHVGDTIEVIDGAISVMCDRVHITARAVYVEETIRFESREDARDYFKITTARTQATP